MPSVVFIIGCASSAPEASAPPPGQVVVGSGTDDERQAIEASNQKIFETEHSASPDAGATSNLPTTP